MPSDTPPRTPPADQARALGQALRSLRERGGVTQEQAAEALGVTRQAWAQYEAGNRSTILRTDLQDRLADALGVSRADLMRERDRQAGVTPEPESVAGGAQVYQLPIGGRVRATPDGPRLYDVADTDSVIDLAWMFGADARTLRQAGDNMTGYVESGQLVIYDLSQWPSRGDGCVVELQTGEVHVAEYVEVAQGVLKVRQRFPEETLTFPMAQVKGVYLVRFRGG